eukprot:CAMPEP_0194275030 /NCGR_PEP_ID=MMETSP0169-20130528/7970_1 /TAXON_ID=218684 /ORGANISM="Corethron pennatum, Strain L29A3" /LENGTH=74 /DNA_ID=CAMNT_0039018391 /DNA_START=1 /DNA_END=222 /DNA_ORIENTATION=+
MKGNHNGTDCLGNEGVRSATALWSRDRARAEAAYGHIGGWALCDVTDLSPVSFLFAYEFNEDISGWDVRAVTDV